MLLWCRCEACCAGIPWMEILERIRPAVPSAVARGYGGTKSHGETGAVKREKREEKSLKIK